MSGSPNILRLSYLSPEAVADRDDVLGGACFARPCPTGPGELPLLCVDMALPGDAPVCEVWHCDEPMRSGRVGPIRYRESASLLFGALTLNENEGADADGALGAAPHLSPLQHATEKAYQAIFALLEARGYTSIVRMWNYFAAINDETHGIERYRQFNVGRQDAFLAQGRSVSDKVPAACALGTGAGGLNIAFLAARTEVRGIENPRQISAYHYPTQYGPRSPTFARAGLIRLGQQNVLFVSGTASIVGHQTLHPGDVTAQTHECLANIAAVVEEANRQPGGRQFALGELAYKVYLRNLSDLTRVESVMRERVGTSCTAVYVQADICRAELLVEIEASGGHAIGPVLDARSGQ